MSIIKKVLARIVPAWLLLSLFVGAMPVVVQEDTTKQKKGHVLRQGNVLDARSSTQAPISHFG